MPTVYILYQQITILMRGRGVYSCLKNSLIIHEENTKEMNV